MSKIEEISRSIEDLLIMIERGTEVVWFYRNKNGTPFYDVYLDLDGKKTNRQGNPIQSEHKKSKDLLLELESKLDELIAINGIVQGSLF